MSSSHKNKVDVSLEGSRLCAYPNPIYTRMLDAYSKENNVSKSQIITNSIKQFFDKLPNETRAKYLKNSY